MTGSPDWAVVFEQVGFGVAALLAGIGILYVCLRTGATLNRLNVTLDRVDRQLEDLREPVGVALESVAGIAKAADETVQKAGKVVSVLERIAGTADKGVSLVGSALSPAVVNLGATLAGITTGLRRFVRGEERP